MHACPHAPHPSLPFCSDPFPLPSFPQNSPLETLEKLGAKKGGHMPKSIVDLATSCCRASPADRPSFEEIVKSIDAVVGASHPRPLSRLSRDVMSKAGGSQKSPGEQFKTFNQFKTFDSSKQGTIGMVSPTETATSGGTSQNPTAREEPLEEEQPVNEQPVNEQSAHPPTSLSLTHSAGDFFQSMGATFNQAMKNLEPKIEDKKDDKQEMV